MQRHPEVKAADKFLKELVQKGLRYMRGEAVRRPSLDEIETAKQEYLDLRKKHHPNYPELD